MEREAFVTVRSEKRLAPNESERIAYTVPAALSDTETGWRLVCREPAEAGMGETLSVYEFTERTLLLERSGGVRARMRFQEGEPGAALYETEAGTLRLSWHTQRLRAKLGAHGGLIDLAYVLTASGQELGAITVRLRIKTIE